MAEEKSPDSNMSLSTVKSDLEAREQNLGLIIILISGQKSCDCAKLKICVFQPRLSVQMLFRKVHGGLCHHARHFSSTNVIQADFTHAVIGGGAVGLAVARRLQQHEGASTVLIEKHGAVGTETSSRNSEVGWFGR